MDWRSLARVQQLLQDAAPSQREKLFWDVYTQLAEYFGQPHLPLQNRDTYRSLARLSPSPWNQVTLCNRTLSNRYEEEFEEVMVLGDGGFGHVVKARNRLDGCCYAIKIIDMEDKGNVSPDQSLQEVRALAKLNNPRVVRYHNAWLQCDLRAWPSVGSSSGGTASDSEEEDEEDSISRTSRDRSDDENGVVPSLPSCHQGSHVSADDSVVFQSLGNGQQRSGGGSPMALQPYRPRQAVPRPRKTLYIQMGLCGESLKEWLDQRNMNTEPVAKDRCMGIFRELTEALTYIHDLGLIHRDVKPANIFFTLEGHHHHIQLGDFGLAKQSVQPPTSRLGADLDLVPVLAQWNTSRVGTKLYTAPEVDRGSNYGQKSDMFSAGITLLELLSSFATNHQRVQEIKHLREERRLDPELRRRWPDIALLILQLTDPDPANRPSSKELLTSPLINPKSPANTAGTTIAPTTVPPDPGLSNGVLAMGEAIRSIKTYNSEVNCVESTNRPSSEKLLTSPLLDPFPPPLSPANTAGTTIASTTVPPDPGLSNGVLAMGEAIKSIKTYNSEVNCIESTNRPSSEELLTSPLLDAFPPPLSPANTTGTTIAPTAVPPDPGLSNGVLAMGGAIGGVETYNSEVNCVELTNRPSSEELLTSPLLDTFPPPLSPANTAGTTIASTTVPPDPGLSNGVLAMGGAIRGVKTNRSEVNHVGTLNTNPVMRSLEVSYVTESSSVINTTRRQISDAEENVILREENSRLKRELAELERKLQHLGVSNSAPPTLDK
ncbi:eukaryotic translation initiation factor 2-alpha kinase 3-like isoform X2 [Eriocheir sinensis]|uniref:eukaryotic translation initiation factor 2-alpha kinase 3-like isoform X2 n=3 Tax=Eriocheir sinensis TaxID=95602 RepID=UPI0021C7EE52|nr:eukaryotic translation initiation factor 2-alpha kinase 3-like isoform X2 [Eriocheir sinensis]